uniref:Transmembrane and coiled-coil domain-containing protein 4 n=1 Tax=Pinguiococcus pyrenoidosus TaxID=172671 RepID=A0A7R9YE27_9STRA|mmetsp:Transcript_4951/g.19804  ORF Transcript_4951/g.19804 Transcript_4951/m.19804 type:complete len:969 (+) Transcript_4951:82-2988(+)
MEDAKTLVCLAALCLPKTRKAADFLRALGIGLGLGSSGVLGAIPLLYDAEEVDVSMLERAESMAVGFRTGLTRERAVKGLVTILLLILRGPELAAALAQAENDAAQASSGMAARLRARLGREEPSKRQADSELLKMLRFDGRTSVLVRRLALLLRVRVAALCALEDLALRQLQQESRLLADAKARQEEGQGNEDDGERKTSSSRNQWMRAAKIGLVATAAGGILAITGGLAAPAIAAGLVGLGFAGTATLATSTTVAALLGTSGAGLGAWKMTNRTRGVKTFEFQGINTRKSTSYAAQKAAGTADSPSENPPDEDLKGMTVYICISGWLRTAGPHPQPEKAQASGVLFGEEHTDPAQSPDFFAPWGAEPPLMTPSTILDRFYNVVAPEKQQLVPFMLQRYEGQEEEIFDALEEKYGVHPRRLAPPPANPDFYVTGGDADVLHAVMMGCLARIRSQTQSTAAAAASPSAAGETGAGAAAAGAEAAATTTTATKTTTEEQEDPREDAPLGEQAQLLLYDAARPWESAHELVSRLSEATDGREAEVLDNQEVEEALQEISDKMEASTDEGEATAETTDASESAPVSPSEPTEMTEELQRALEQEMGEIDIEGSPRSEGGPSPQATSAGGVTTDETVAEEEVRNLPQDAKAVASEVSETSSSVWWWRKEVAHYGDQFTLIWEPALLHTLGQSFEALIREGISKGITHSLKYTVLNALLAAVAWPVQILSFLSSLDETWVVAVEKADEAGKILAEALMSGAHGDRPVVLVGFSVGGRVVASCLGELAAIASGKRANSSRRRAAEPAEASQKDGEEVEVDSLFEVIEEDKNLSKQEKQRRLRAATIVRDAVIIGAPVDTSKAKWAMRRSVVLGRLVNVYSTKDWILALLYRYKKWSVLALAGLQAVHLPSSSTLVGQATGTAESASSKRMPSIENFNVSDIVGGHDDYPDKMMAILQRIGIGDVKAEELQCNYF